MHKNGEAYVNGTSRYVLSGKYLPDFRDYFEKYVGLNVEYKVDPQTFSEMKSKIPKSRICKEFIDGLEKIGKPYKFLSFDDECRLLHGHGHSCQELFQLRYGEFHRIPDVVIYPSCHSDVEKIVKLSQEHPIAIIPYGGGTTVTQSLMCPEDEERMIVSLDMQEMNKIRWVDLDNSTACIEAGASGAEIQDQLSVQGLTLGHEPDSFEFSTLGGWVSTRASGMKKNVYGNIEDFVLKIKFVTALGTIDIPIETERKSMGPDLHQLILGHEGSLGVVTECVVRISKTPECSIHGSVIFPDFDSGVAALHELAAKKMAPASVRLLDNVMFQFGQALKIKTDSYVEPWIEWAKKMMVTKVYGFNHDKMCAATLLFEGPKDEVEYQQKRVYEVLKKHGGLKAGEKAGSQGYLLTYVVAYLRDYGMAYYFLAESFETTVPWKNVIQLDKNVKKRMIDAAKKKGVEKELWVSVRVTQTYKCSACLYYYFGFSFRNLKSPLKVFSEIEEEARDEILKNGGSLSHHHGVGKLRRQFMKQAVGDVAFEILKKIKKELDPKNTFNTGNMNLTKAKMSEWK